MGQDPYHAWESVRVAAGKTAIDRPHILRHTCVNLFVRLKVPLVKIAAFTEVGASVVKGYSLNQTVADQQNIVQTAHQRRSRNGSK